MKDGGIGGFIGDGGGLCEVMTNILDARNEIANDYHAAGRSLHSMRDYRDIEVIKLGKGVEDKGVFNLEDCDEVGEEGIEDIGLAIAAAIIILIFEPNAVGSLAKMLGKLPLVF